MAAALRAWRNPNSWIHFGLGSVVGAAVAAQGSGVIRHPSPGAAAWTVGIGFLVGVLAACFGTKFWNWLLIAYLTLIGIPLLLGGLLASDS